MILLFKSNGLKNHLNSNKTKANLKLKFNVLVIRKQQKKKKKKKLKFNALVIQKQLTFYKPLNYNKGL
jgi:hypothetical protein